VRILLINPPIYDFSAYDYWIKPLGLLYISSILKENNIEVGLIDAMNRFDEYFKNVKSDEYGRGKFPFKKMNKPDVLKKIPLYFKRYGLPSEIIKERIIEFKPDFVFVTTTMTYWYLGAKEILELVKSIDKKIPVFLGGIYPTLLFEHAISLGFDDVFRNNELKRVGDIIGIKIPNNFKDFPPPDYSFYRILKYVAITTSLGCPFRCSYCASYKITPDFQFKEPEIVYDEIRYFYEKGIRDFVIYDDALLFPQDRFISLFKKVGDNLKDIRIHTPNGLHARFIDTEIAEIMKKANFIQPRISLETINREKQLRTGGKIFTDEFEEAVNRLIKTGYKSSDIIAYIIFGLPDDTIDECQKTMDYLHSLKVTIYLSEFSPIPASDYYDVEDPLLSNNTIYLHYKNRGKELQFLKDYKNKLNRILKFQGYQ